MSKTIGTPISYSAVVLSSLLYATQIYAVDNAISDPWVGLDFRGRNCSQLDGTYVNRNFGPYDYTTPLGKKHLRVVENRHFTPQAEQLLPELKGALDAGKISVGGMEYTAKAFPNHHKALRSMAQYQLIYGYDIRKGTKDPVNPPVECFMQRAMNFAPKDSIVYIIFATFLKKSNIPDVADKVYQQGIEANPDSTALRYNYGTFLIEQQQYPEALEQAKVVYEKGYPKQFLKKKLISEGYWNE